MTMAWARQTIDLGTPDMKKMAAIWNRPAIALTSCVIRRDRP